MSKKKKKIKSLSLLIASLNVSICFDMSDQGIIVTQRKKKVAAAPKSTRLTCTTDIIINSKLLFCFILFLQKDGDCTVKTAKITLNVQALVNVPIMQQLKVGKKLATYRDC